MPRPILTLTTDFGLSDHFVGAMKGAILSVCPRAQIVDISHQVAPFAIAEGAYLIAQAHRFFRAGTVHVVVVDPGVGTARRPILAEAAGQYFVAPDNGVLSLIYSTGKHRVRVITNEKYFRKPVSRTFHGRDIFGPVAAHLGAGVAPARFGKAIADFVRLPLEHPQKSGKSVWTGQVLQVDRFGNVVTNFSVSEFPHLRKRKFTLLVGRNRISAIADTYTEHAPGELFLIAGSSGYLEISTNQGSAARQLECATGSAVELKIG